MTVCAYSPILYGREYLAYSIKSYMDLVDKIYILYTSRGSYGYGGDITCYESEQELKDIAFGTSNKIEWINVNAGSEGAHRGHIEQFSASYDMIVAADYDEVFKTDELEQGIKQAYDMPYRRYGIANFKHFFRDFNNICVDGFRPIRIYKQGGVGEYLEMPITIYHFGYAISEQLQRFKWLTHGHHDELRPNWIDEVYLNPNRTTDLHPVSLNLWNTQPFDKQLLPEFMKSHPKFKL